MNNKKIIRNIIVGVVVIGCLTGALIWAYNIPETNPQDVTDNKEITEDIIAFEVSEQDVNSISFENEFASFTILNKGEGEYEIKNSGSISYSSAMLGSDFRSLLKIYAKKDMTDEKVDFIENARVTLNMNDKSKETLILGNEVIGQNQYLLKYEDKIYAVSKGVSNLFLSQPNDYRERTLATISSQIKAFEIKKNSQNFIKIKASETEEEASVSDIGASYIMTYPKKMAVNMDRLGELLEFIGEGYTINVISFADDNISNKSKYNIGKTTVILEDETSEYTLQFGDTDENGNVYAVLNDNNYIFTMNPGLFNLVSQYSPDNLMDRMAHLVLITKINQVVFEGNGQKYILDISGNEGSYSYKINGKETEESKFKEVYREIIGITVDSMANSDINVGEAEYTVTFKYLDNSEVKYTYVPYDERNYILKKNGVGEKILLKKYLIATMENIKNILK